MGFRNVQEKLKIYLKGSNAYLYLKTKICPAELKNLGVILRLRWPNADLDLAIEVLCHTSINLKFSKGLLDDFYGIIEFPRDIILNWDFGFAHFVQKFSVWTTIFVKNTNSQFVTLAPRWIINKNS